MKFTASSITLAVLAASTVTGLSVEGARSLWSRINDADLSSRLTQIEQTQRELVDKQNYLFELLDTAAISDADTTPVVGVSAIRVEKTGRRVKYEDLDLFCLAKNIFHEAGVEDELGMYAVAQVTINRVRHAGYPSTVCDVVMQPSQFSWANDKSRRWTHPTGPKWDLAKNIAHKVITEGYRVPALQSAMFYHADYSKPSWRDPNAVVAQVGTHIFYTAAR